MAGNQAVFDAALRRAQGYAFENGWDKALKEYQRALAEFPNDVGARTNYAQALYRLGQYAPALEEYTGLLKARANDPFLLGRVAEIHAALGRRADALTVYGTLAQVYVGQNQPREAIATYRAILALDPTRRDAHERLVDLYKGAGERAAAVGELLVLSRLALEGPPEDLAGAVRYAEAAFALDSNGREAREWLYKLRRRQAEVAGTSPDEKMLRTGNLERQQTLDASNLNEMLTLAMSYQERGQYAIALKQYETVLGAGLRTPQVYYNLGLLYQQAGQPANAAPNFQQAATDPEYGMSSQYALGICYRDLGQVPEAATAFEAAVRQVDLQSISKAEVPDLIELYEAAAGAQEATGNAARAASLFTTLTGFLQTRRWKTGRTTEIAARAEALSDQSMSAKLRRIGGEAEPVAPAPPRPPMAAPSAPPPMAAPAPPVPAAPAEREPLIRPIGAQGGIRPIAPAPAPTMGADESPIYLRSGPPAPMVPGARNPSGILRPITDFLKPPAPPANDPHSSGNGPALPPASPSLLAAVAAAPLPPMPTPPGGTGRTAAATLAASPALRGLESTAQPSYTGNPVLDAQIERSISDSDEYMAHGQLFAATDACFDVIRLAPDFLPIHLRLAEIARLRGKPEDATTKLHSVVDLYLARGESVAASQVYPALINLQPLDVHLRTKLAALLTDLGERDAAVEQYLALSDMLFTTGQHDRALEELRRLQRLAPQNAQVRLQAGTYLLRLDRAEEALGEFSRALQLDPDNQLALVRVYVTLVLLDKETQWDALQTVLAQAQTNAMTREIIGEEVRAQALVTERPALFYTLGLIYEMEHPETAMSAEEVDEFASTRLAAMRGAWEQGLALLHPGDRSVLAVLLRWRAGKMALALHDGAAAVPLYQEVMALLDDPALEPSPRPTLEFIKLPERQHVYLPLAEAYSLNAQPAEAIEALQTAKTHLPYNREIYTKLADLYFRRGQLGAALVAMEELVNHYQETYQTDKMLEALGYMARLAPSNIPVRRKLADIYLKRGMLDQGLAELELLSNLQRKEGLVKDAVQTLQRASDIYLTMGHHTEAYAVYAQIVRMAPGDVDARQQLINLYIQTGRLADAAHEQKDLAEICLAQGMVQPAIAALHQLIALAPQDPYGYYALAEVLASGGEYGQAARLYNRLRRLEPDNPKLGPLQAEMQRLAEAGTRVDSER